MSELSYQNKDLKEKQLLEERKLLFVQLDEPASQAKRKNKIQEMKVEIVEKSKLHGKPSKKQILEERESLFAELAALGAKQRNDK